MDYNGLQEVTGAYRGLERVKTRDTRGYRRLQRVTRG